MTDEIVWRDPPPPGRGAPRRVAVFVEALKSRPGEWALYPHPVTAPSITQAASRYPGTEWTTRQRPDGKRDCYARWIGDQT